MEIKLPVKGKMAQEKSERSELRSQELSHDDKSRVGSAIARERVNSQKEPSGSQSPTSLRFAKTMSKIVLQQALSNMDQISQTQIQINHLVEELDSKLQSSYYQKEANLMQAYRQQLITGHKELTELKNNNNEQQIKNQMNEKFLQLKKERLELIQANMFYSNKCQEYKKIMDAKISDGDELQGQIKFLEKQINNSNQKKIQLMSQIYQNHSPLKSNHRDNSENDSHRVISLENIKFEDEKTKPTNRNLNFDESTPNKKVSLSTHANSEIIRKMGLTSGSKEKLKIHPNKIPEINSQVKKIFHDKLLSDQNLYTDRSAAKSGTILTKLSLLQNENTQSKKESHKQASQIEALFMKTVNSIKEKKASRRQIALFKGEEFTDLEKKEIMRAFLSQEEVKQYIYNIIFDKTEDSTLFRKKALKEKFKIVASDKKQAPIQ